MRLAVSDKAGQKPIYFATAEEFRTWLDAHHESSLELLVEFYKKGSKRPSLTWPESVDEALCFGWIDGVRRSLGDESYVIRFTPRKRGSIWSNVNIRKAEALVASGRMRAAGLRAFEAREAKKCGIYAFEQPKLRSESARAEGISREWASVQVLRRHAHRGHKERSKRDGAKSRGERGCHMIQDSPHC